MKNKNLQMYESLPTEAAYTIKLNQVHEILA